MSALKFISCLPSTKLAALCLGSFAQASTLCLIGAGGLPTLSVTTGLNHNFQQPQLHAIFHGQPWTLTLTLTKVDRETESVSTATNSSGNRRTRIAVLNTFAAMTQLKSPPSVWETWLCPFGTRKARLRSIFACRQQTSQADHWSPGTSGSVRRA